MFHWSRINARFALGVVALGSACLLGCGKDSQADDGNSEQAEDEESSGSALITASEGGTVISDDGRVTLEIPPDALDEDTEISIVASSSASENGLGATYELSPDGLQFETPARLSMELEVTKSEQEKLWLPVVWNEGDVPELLDAFEVELLEDEDVVRLSGDIEHFSQSVGSWMGLRYTLSVPDAPVAGEEFSVDLTVSPEPDFEFTDQMRDWLSVSARLTGYQAGTSTRDVALPEETGYVEADIAVTPPETRFEPAPKYACLDIGADLLVGAFDVSLDILHRDFSESQRAGTIRWVFNIDCTCSEAAGTCPKACCLETGECQTMPPPVCTAKNGAVAEADDCEDAQLCESEWACCTNDLGAPEGPQCENLTTAECMAQGALSVPGAMCGPGVCPEIPCCLDADCEIMDGQACIEQGGTPQDVSTCEEAACGGEPRFEGTWYIADLAASITDPASECVSTSIEQFHFLEGGIVLRESSEAWGEYTQTDNTPLLALSGAQPMRGTWSAGEPGSDGKVEITIDLCGEPDDVPDGLCADNYASFSDVVWDPVAGTLLGTSTTTRIEFNQTTEECDTLPEQAEDRRTVCSTTRVDTSAQILQSQCTGMCSFWSPANLNVTEPGDLDALADSVQPCVTSNN